MVWIIAGSQRSAWHPSFFQKQFVGNLLAWRMPFGIIRVPMIAEVVIIERDPAKIIVSRHDKHAGDRILKDRSFFS